MKRILVTGAGGFVGSRILQQWNGRYELLTLPKGFFAAADETAVRMKVEQVHPDVILHTAAISDTGYCAQHPEEAFRANVELPVWLAKAAQETGAKLLAFSSDQVYAGVRQAGPLPETQELSPSNCYGAYKLEAEQRALAICPQSVHLRATWMYDLPGYGLPIRGNLLMNLLSAALRSETVSFSRNDHRGVTYVRQAVENLIPAMDLPGGVYNFGSSNDTDMVHTAQQFAQAMGICIRVEEADWKRNLVMDNAKAGCFGIHFDTMQQGIHRCLQDYGIKNL